jgi:hypothetical protein
MEFAAGSMLVLLFFGFILLVVLFPADPRRPVGAGVDVGGVRALQQAGGMRFRA